MLSLALNGWSGNTEPPKPEAVSDRPTAPFSNLPTDRPEMKANVDFPKMMWNDKSFQSKDFKGTKDLKLRETDKFEKTLSFTNSPGFTSSWQGADKKADFGSTNPFSGKMTTFDGQLPNKDVAGWQSRRFDTRDLNYSTNTFMAGNQVFKDDKKLYLGTEAGLNTNVAALDDRPLTAIFQQRLSNGTNQVLSMEEVKALMDKASAGR